MKVSIATIMMSDENDAKQVEILQFLFRIGHLLCGEGFRLDHQDVTETQRKAIRLFDDLGMVVCPEGSNVCFPTELGTMVLSSQTAASKGIPSATSSFAHDGSKNNMSSPSLINTSLEQEPLRIIVETNFHVYAYVTSPMYILLIKYFVHIEFVTQYISV